MVGKQLPLLAAALVIHFFAASTWAASVAVKAAETVSNGKSLAHAHAASNVQRVNVAETQQAMSSAQLRGLRTKVQSSHGRRANVFRAAASSAVRSTLTAKEKQAPAPVFIVKMGLANVTEPTPYPPPPPVLHPWKEMQPLDTAIGNYLISGLIAQPTVTPPPSQSSLDLAFACPALLTWPTEVSAPARFKHAWPLLVAQEIVSLELLELIPIDGLQKAGMKLGAAVAVKQVMEALTDGGKKKKKVGGKVAAATAAGMDTDSNDDEEEAAVLEQMLRQSFAPAQFNKRWKRLQDQMVTDLKVLGGCTVMQLQEIGIKLGGAAAIKHAVRGL